MDGAAGLMAGFSADPSGFSPAPSDGLKAGFAAGAGATAGPLGAATRGAGAAGCTPRGLSAGCTTAGAGATLVGADGRVCVDDDDALAPALPGSLTGTW